MIELSGIRKSFGRHEVLKGIDLEVAQGEVVSILGPSGSGKTTLLRCINFLERADEGQIRIGNQTVDCRRGGKKEVLALRRKTAMVFQHYNLFRHKTALQNVMEGLAIVQKMPWTEARELGMEMLEKVGLADKCDAYPSQLSGGQQQRVGIARALALRPEVILFDEPTSSLDPELVGEVLSVMRKIAREGMTMIVVTHELDFARDISTHSVFVDQGTIVERGKGDDLFLRPQEQRTQKFLKRGVSE